MHQSSVDFSPNVGSPFIDEFFRNDKELRLSFLHAVALVILATILAGLYYVYSILDPFIFPLFWALLFGLVLHPYKRHVTSKLRLSLVRLEQKEELMVFAVAKTLLLTLDGCCEAVGNYFLERWRPLLGLLVGMGLAYGLYTYTPGTLTSLLLGLTHLLLHTLPAYFEKIQVGHVAASLCACGAGLLLVPSYRRLCKALSLLTWLLLIARTLNYLWTPLLYGLAVIVLIGYVAGGGGVEEVDQADGETSSRIRAFIILILTKINILQPLEETDSGVTDRDETRVEGPAASTPILAKMAEQRETESPLGVGRLSELRLGAIIPHPGVSALKKEHGILSSRPNISDIGKGFTPVGSNTPKSRLGRSFRFAKRKASLNEIHHDSIRYIYGALWGCGFIQLWLHPSLVHFLPGPILYSLIKRVFVYSGAWGFILDQVQNVSTTMSAKYSTYSDLVVPGPVQLAARLTYTIERKCLQTITCHLDSLVTSLMLLAMVLVVTAVGIFISFQVYAESVYIFQSLSSIASSLQMADSPIFSALNISADASMEEVMNDAYNYGRNWITATLRKTLEGADPSVKSDLETKVLELWDRSYQYWILKQEGIGPKVNQDAITNSFGEVLERLFTYPDLFNLSSLQVFIKNNMGTLTSILEQIWSLLQGNLMFLLQTILGTLRVLLYSGSGFVNFVFGIVIYLTALFYLLSNSTTTYKPMELLSQYSMFHLYGTGSALQTAVNSVLFITVKMSSFYLLWTYLTHNLFQASIVVLPMLFSSFIAAVPFTGQYIVAIPASLELWLLQGRPAAAFLLIVAQVAPSWVVDAAIYSEMKGGLHPWFTGLAVVGGVYVFGVVGAVYGPLALCLVYVLANMYSTFMQDTQPPTPVGHPSMRTPLNRSETFH